MKVNRKIAVLLLMASVIMLTLSTSSCRRGYGCPSSTSIESNK